MSDKPLAAMLYPEYYKHFIKLTLEERGALVTAMFEHALNGHVTVSLSEKADMAFSFIQDRIDADAQKYREKCELNAANGKKGGRPPKRTVIEETERFSEKPKKPNYNINSNNNINNNLSPFPPPGESAGFEAFWSAYPKKQNKQNALKAWDKLNPDLSLVETIVAAVERAKRSETWIKDGGRFIPLPTTYLNGRRWEDEGLETHQRLCAPRKGDWDFYFDSEKKS